MGKEELLMDLPEKVKKELSTFLHKTEKILYSFKGMWGSHSRWTDSSTRTSARILSGGKVDGAGTQWGSPWLILTNERLLIIGKGLLTLDIREIPYEHIKSIDYEQGIFQDRLMILSHSSTEAIQFHSNDRKYTKQFPPLIKEKIKGYKKSDGNETTKIDNLSQIEKLAQLLEKGIITKNEFNKKKKELLKKL